MENNGKNRSDNALLEQMVKIAQQNQQMIAAMNQDKQRTKEKDGWHYKQPAAIGTYTELHGNGSLFGSQPIERDVISAYVRPHGLAATLPAFPSVSEHPWFASLTGYTATSGSEPSNPCDDAPAGFVKSCYLTAQFGRVMRDTQTIEIDKVMLRKNRGDFTDLMLRGRVLGDETGGLLRPSNLSQEDILNIVTKSEMVTAAVNLERTLSQMIWQGSPSANTANGGYKEFPGLDNQIATGQVDAETNDACSALDSDVKDFNYSAVDGTDKDIVEYLSMLEYYLRYNAMTMGLDPVQWVVVMRPELWFELSAVWPCSYLSHRCNTASGAEPIVINDNVNVSLRDNMRNNMFIDINGNRYPVVVDTGISEATNITDANVGLGQYASSIYMVPLTIVGNFPVTYWEFVDYRQAEADIALLNGKNNFWSDDGRFMWGYEDTAAFCYKLKVKTEPRIVLRTPQLAGRIDNVLYQPLQHLREGYADSPYFQDGGASLRPDETYNAVWL